MDVEELIAKRRRHRIRLILILLILIGLSCIVIFVFRLKNVTIEGSTFYTENEVEKMIFTNKFEQNTLGFWLENQFLGHKDLPFVREYKVNFAWPDGIHVKLYEKTIIAGVQYMNEFIYFDKDGLVLESSGNKRDTIPLFQIQNIKNFSLYQTIDMGDKGLLKRILQIANLMDHYHLQVERIEFNDVDEAFLYAGNIQIDLGSGSNYDDAMAALETVLPTALENKLAGEIDLSTYQVGDNIILKKKEDA